MASRRLAPILALACALMLVSSTAGAQLSAPAQLRFERLSVEQGLSQSIIRAVFQDHKGFIWIATQNGLNLYDGYRVTLFKHESGNPNSLPSSYVTSIAETQGADGHTLWLGTLRGVAAFDVSRNRFQLHAHDPSSPAGLSHDSITTLFVDRAGVLWAGTHGGLNRFDAATQSFIRFPHPLTNRFVTAIAEDRDGALWVGTGAGLNRIDRERSRVTRFLHNPADRESLNDNYIRSLLVDTRGRLWIGTDAGGLDRFDPGAGRFVHHVHSSDPGSLSGNSVNALLEDARGDLWVGVWGGGVNRLLPGRSDQPAFIAYRHDATDPQSLAVDDVNVLSTDRSGAIWVGTYAGGVNRFVPEAVRPFAHYKHVPRDPGSLGDNRVYALHVDRAGTLWVGTWGGLYRLPRGATGFESHLPDRARPGSVSDVRITSLAEGRDGTMWAGTLDGGVNRLDVGASAFRHYRAGRAGALNSDRVTSLHVDRQGIVWVGTLTSGINRLDPVTGKVTYYRHDPSDAATISEMRIQKIFEDSDGRLWVGTSRGLDILDRTSGLATRLSSLPGAPQALGRLVDSIAESPRGRIWVGTDDGVVSFEVPVGGTTPANFKTYRERDGLSNDRVHRVLADSDGDMWISTDNGVTRLHPADGSVVHFDVADGLQGNEFKSGGFFDAPTGRLFLGGINGFSVFRPADVKPSAYTPPVVLTGMTILNEPVPIGATSPLNVHIYDAHSVTLSPRDTVFSFEFAALDYVASRRTRYAYMLSGFDRHWSETDASRRFATYTNLSPGTYTFLVRASNHGKVWSEPRRLTVVILPPFWMTWWFRGAAGLLLIIVVAAVHHRRVTAVERQRNELEQIVTTRTAELRREKEKVVAALRAAEDANAAKTTFLANISHEIRTPLNAIVGMADVLRDTTLNADQQEYVGALKAAGEALSELIDDTLELSKIEVGRYEVEAVPFDLRQLVGDTVTVIELAAKKKGIAIGGSIGLDLPALVSGDPRALRRVLLNLLGNALKFTPAGGITIVVQREEAGADNVQFVVSDTGIGIPADKHERVFDMFAQADLSTAREYGGTGLGLALCRQLVELMGGSIALQSEPGKGSTFSFSVPLPACAPTATRGDRAPRRPPASRRSLRILLVEDSPQNRMLLQAYLKDTAHEIEFADTGEAGVDECQSGEYDLVLMDVNLPDISGYEATRRIRHWESGHNRHPIPIIALTAHAFVEDVENSRRAGCDEHLAKPIRKSVLLNVLDRYARASASPPRVAPDLPRELAAYVPEYLRLARRELMTALAAFERGERSALRTLGHNLKGSAASFGLDEVGAIAGRLERAAIEGLDAEMRAGAEELGACLERFELT